MDLATLIPLVIKGSIFLQVLCLGLTATMEEALYLLHRPSELLRSIISMNIMMPIIATALVLSFHFERTVEIALLTLSVSPIPPILPKKQLKAGGRSPYTIGLLAGVSLLSIVVVPLTVYLVGKVIGTDASMPPAAVARLMITTVLLPLVAGIAFRRVAPALAGKISKPLSSVGMILLLAGAIPIVIVAWPAIISLIKEGGILPIVIFVVMGLAVGHLFGGPNPEDRTVLALSTATRHPGVALAIAGANATGGNKIVLAAVLLYLIVNAIVSIPYVNWRKHRQQTRLAAAA